MAPRWFALSLAPFLACKDSPPPPESKTTANTALATALGASLGNEQALKKLVDDLRKQYLSAVNKNALSAIVVDGTGNVRRAGS